MEARCIPKEGCLTLSDTTKPHIPVLLEDVVRWLSPMDGESVLDATVGLAGHAERILRAVGPSGRLIGLDLDAQNLQSAGDRLRQSAAPFLLVQGNFAHLDHVLDRHRIGPVDILLADLGFSSNQLLRPKLGLSFTHDAPLDMRLDANRSVTASELLNTLSSERLADLLYHNADERASRRIAAAIVAARRIAPIRTSGQLAQLVSNAVGRRRGRLHPATKTFLALRIAVNHEIENLQLLLERAPSVLAQGGRIGLISFHSQEDRLVKQNFAAMAGQSIYEILTAKPIISDRAAIRANPRTRSAKLRVARRTALSV